MAQFRFFADRNDGSVVQFDAKKVQLKDVPGSKKPVLSGWNGVAWEPFTRSIKMKSMPSKHECDARCMYATGKTMQCECSCGGANHGRGSFSCVAA